ncbi:MAG: hypothetical protein AAGF12_34440 [Myxococcota bacterium]
MGAAEALEFEPLKLPEAAAVKETLSLIINAPAELSAVAKAKPTRIRPNSKDWYGCVLLGDKDEVLGAILSDLEGTVRFGGRLLMLPKVPCDDFIKNKNPSEDVLDACSEVFNTLCSVFNHVSGNEHVRIAPLGQLSAQPIDWTKTARRRLEYKVKDYGHLVLLVR